MRDLQIRKEDEVMARFMGWDVGGGCLGGIGGVLGGDPGVVRGGIFGCFLGVKKALLP